MPFIIATPLERSYKGGRQPHVLDDVLLVAQGLTAY
jgi:hypothetical protein